MLGDAALEEFSSDEKLKRAISMTVINIGELIKNVTDDFRKSHPGVPWRAVAGMRDIAAHKYQTLRMEDVYITVKEDFPSLRKQLVYILEIEAALSGEGAEGNKEDE
nr:HepT-like ribonuclease domain-containing protein [uncultured Schaedlerella sp.]